nr:PD-(D/E)XK nuclease family transposase [Virgibacillus sp. YIM 98842]
MAINFDLFKQTKRSHTSHHLYEDQEQFQLTNVMEFHFLEMGKLIKHWKKDKLDPWNNTLAKWLLLLGNGKVYEVIYDAAQREAELRIQEAEHKAEEKAQQKIKETERKAERKAERKVEQRAENIDRRLLEKGMEIKNVAEATGLEENKVREIHRDVQN